MWTDAGDIFRLGKRFRLFGASGDALLYAGEFLSISKVLFYSRIVFSQMNAISKVQHVYLVDQGSVSDASDAFSMPLKLNLTR